MRSWRQVTPAGDASKRHLQFRLIPHSTLRLPPSHDPREILKKIRQIELRTNRLVTETLAGQYHSVFKGQGMNFEEVREYPAWR